MEVENESEAKSVKPRRSSIKVKLIEPIEFGSETISEITLKPIRGKHLRNLPSTPTLNDILKLASKISGVSSAIFDEMCSEDVIRVSEAVGELF
jgi:hypothetical protein